jgi:hypothetical protein
MVGNSENIYTDFDFNNITIIDPNKVVDEFGNVKERYVNQENLVMYANLECKMIPRTKLAVGATNDDSDISTISVATINFLKPGGKEYLDNSWTDTITGENVLKGAGKKTESQDQTDAVRQQTLSDGKVGSIDSGLLGITNITISNNESFLTTVSMRLVDVKGKAMFESGNNSPYAAFFNLPYPKFYLTVKGFYGKAIRLELMLQNFSTTYDSFTSNFDIQLNFFTYKYTVLTEISMGMLLATPHMYKSSVQVKAIEGTPNGTNVPVNQSYVELGYQKIREMYSEYKSKGLIPDDFPEITIMQLQDRLENFIKNVLDSYTKQNLVPLDNIETYLKTVNEYSKEVFYYQGTSWFNKYMDTASPYILQGVFKTKVFTFQKKYNQQDQENAVAELKGLIDKFNNQLTNNETLGNNGSYTINGTVKKSSIPVNITYEKSFLIEVPSADDINFVETFKAISGDTYPTENELLQLQNEYKKNDFFGTTVVKNESGIENVKRKFFVFENNSAEINNKVSNFSNPTFIGEIDNIIKQVEQYRQQIQEELGAALAELLQSGANGIGFVPNIRNVLAVFFASGEAFLRLMDDVHRDAWNQRDNPNRKAAIFDKEVAGASQDNLNSGFDKNTPVYPWPQFLVKTLGEKGQEKYEIRYPGDSDVIGRTRGFLHDVWPEIEFEEEFIKGYVQRSNRPQPPSPKTNDLKDTNRISLNAIEFPVNNVLYYNKEEIKFLFEIYERVSFVSNYSKLSRTNNSIGDSDKITNLIAEGESINIVNALNDDNPFLQKKLKEYGFNATNYLTTLRHFSNDGTGQSWQNYLRAINNTSYIKNLIQNAQFEFIDPNILLSTSSQPTVALTDEDSLSEYISNSTKSNIFDFTDIYPFVINDWCINNLSNGTTLSDSKNAFSTEKVLKYNKTQKVISNFTPTTTNNQVKPITNFIFKQSDIPTSYIVNLKSFYENRLDQYQLVTEGNISYNNYSGLVTSLQTSSILNTPIFINSILDGVQKFRNYDKNPYVTSAYLFLNSLPLATLREKYRNYEGGTTSTGLDYIFATIKKFGAIHQVPYAWILKYGSVWYRYKTWVQTGVDILDNSWDNFKYIENFDPVNNDPMTNYGLIIKGAPIDIVLEDENVIGTETSTLINIGFYPKLINDFNVFYQGYQVFSGYTSTDIQSGIDSGVNLNYVTSSFINLPEGFDSTNLMRDLRVIPWTVDVNSKDGVSTFLFPSHASLINQTFNECFEQKADGTKIKFEVKSNNAMYNGSVRLFWAAPQYGYFDLSKITKPTPEEYLKKIFNDTDTQENYSLNGPLGYSKISEMFSVFEKETLDEFEKEFLNFSKARYDFVDSGLVKQTSMTDNLTQTVDVPGATSQVVDGNNQLTYKFKNFHIMMTEMMKVPKTNGDTGEQIVKTYQEYQTKNISNLISSFMNFNVGFKCGNPTNYDRRVFGSFTSVKISDPYTWDSYKQKTPNALPSATGTITLAQSQIDYPDAWKTLKVYVGFSEIPELQYSNSGSYITDFFIDFDVAFNENNIKNLKTIIKLYASQKLLQFQTNPTPPSLPATSSSNNDILEIITLSDGNKIIIFGPSGVQNFVILEEPQKFAVMVNTNDQQIYTGDKISKFDDPSNDGIINDALIGVYGSLITSPTIENRQVEPTPQYPSSPNPQGKWSIYTFTNTIDNYVRNIEDFQNKIINNLFQKLQKNLKSVVIQTQSNEESALEGKQSKVDLWETFKAINDKWIAGNDFKNKSLFEDVLLMDRASRDIGDKILIDIYKLRNRLQRIDPTHNMMGTIESILTENNFVTIYVPAYVNFYNVQDATKNPKPKLDSTSDFANNMFGTFMNVDYRDSSTKMVNFYGGKSSEIVDVKDNADFKRNDDSFDITKTADNPLEEDQINKTDWDKSNKVAGFNVEIGPQNQSIFYGFNINQDNSQSTAEALAVLNQMANQAGNRPVATQNVSLYNLYKSRSYTCNLIMMGNAMIQPTMYFNLKHVPMFYGPYMIMKVTHTITPGNFETTVTGVRQPTANLPKIDNFIQKLRINLIESVVEESKRQREAINEQAKQAENIKSQTQLVNNNATTNPANTTSTNQSCTANTVYQSVGFVVGPTQKITKTISQIKTIINTIVSQSAFTEKTKLELLLFCSSYITTGTQTGFQTNNNNFIGLDISENWGLNYMTNNYFCSTDNKPYASFNSPEDSFRFLSERWGPKVNNNGLLDITAKEITKFWIINFAANTTNGDSIYTSFDPNQLSTIESEVQNAINLYNASN